MTNGTFFQPLILKFFGQHFAAAVGGAVGGA
jgi:hypothetical protein